jgi:hypothetical protein
MSLTLGKVFEGNGQLASLLEAQVASMLLRIHKLLLKL